MCLGRSEVRLASPPPFSVLGPWKKKETRNQKERRKIGPCFPREAAFSQASSLLLLVDCSMTGFPLSWALLARLRSDPASNNWKTIFPFPMVKLFHSLAQALSDNKTLPALRFKTCRQKKRQSIRIKKKKMEIVNQDLDGSLSLSLSTEIPIYIERNLYMNRSRLFSIRIDMSLWATTPIFICFGHVRFRSEEEGLDLSILCREGCDLC